MEKLTAWKKYLCCWSGMAESAEKRGLSVKITLVCVAPPRKTLRNGD